MPEMEEVTYKRLKGSQTFRQRLLLATLTSTAIRIVGIHADDTFPGLRDYEESLFVFLLEKLCEDVFRVFSDTGTQSTYKPGIIMGGCFNHDCVGRSIGYFLEPLIVLGLFAKKPLTITLTGITNDFKDPSVDTFQSTTLPLLKRFGVPSEGLDLKILSRGSPPQGSGEVVLKIPIVESLKAVSWTDAGMVKNVRGCTFSTRVSCQLETTMIGAARDILKPLTCVNISTDHSPSRKLSPGYGISLVVETSSGCFLSADTAVSSPRAQETNDIEDEKKYSTPDDVGTQIASVLHREIHQRGVGFLFLLCALSARGVSKVWVGKLTPYGIQTLRIIADFLGVKFDIEADQFPGTVLLTCVGCGLRNLFRKAS